MDYETLFAFLVCFILIKISSIKHGGFSVPHLLLNGLKVVIPSLESLNNLNETKSSSGQRQKKKNKGVPVVRKHKTVNDRVEALKFEVENVESGMFMRYSCWEEYNNLVLFSICCAVGFVVIEGWRLVEHQVRFHHFIIINPHFHITCTHQPFPRPLARHRSLQDRGLQS